MDKLTKFEKKFNTPRSHWTKTQWRKVALHFAGIELIETRGRKAKTPKEIYNDEQNLSAAAFWRDDARTKQSKSEDARTKQSKSEDEVVFEVSERTKWDKLSKSSANKIIRNDAIKRDAQRKKKEEEEQANKKEEEEQANKKEEEEQANKKEKKPPTLSALTKAIQENQKKMREK